MCPTAYQRPPGALDSTPVRRHPTLKQRFLIGDEGIEGVRYALWDMTRWHERYEPCIWRSRATEEQKRVGWEMWVRMEKIIATVLAEAQERQTEEAMDAFAEGPDSFYG